MLVCRRLESPFELPSPLLLPYSGIWSITSCGKQKTLTLSWDNQCYHNRELSTKQWCLKPIKIWSGGYNLNSECDRKHLGMRIFKLNYFRIWSSTFTYWLQNHTLKMCSSWKCIWRCMVNNQPDLSVNKRRRLLLDNSFSNSLLKTISFYRYLGWLALP